MYEATTPSRIEEAFERAKEVYAAFGVDAEAALAKAAAVPVSVHCWQADDVKGLERPDAAVDGGGIMATGGHPGRARDGDEIRADLAKALSLLPGRHRVNVHAFYAETGGRAVGRDELSPEHFARWLDWARGLGLALDFNPTYFAHPMAADGATLSHREGRVRDFWVRHGVASRRIAEHFARDLGSPAGCNHWVPDGDKDSPADRFGPRARLVESLDRVLDDANGIDRSLCVDSVEGKLFGIGSEDYVVGSHELYLAYAVTRGVTYCMDMGHFHPTEGVHDKLSAVLQFAPRVLLHVSRPVRWDSDHVVIVNDDLRAVFQELARGEALDRASIALDYFDASMNRIAAYVTGARATRKAILMALLEPAARLRELEAGGRRGEKLALMEEAKSMPWGAAWDEMCLREGRPVGASWLDDVRRYEGEVLQVRSS